MKMMLESLQNMFRENPLRSFLSLFALVAGSFLLGSAWGIADSLERLLAASQGDQGLILAVANGTIEEDGTWNRTMPPEFDAGVSEVLSTAIDGASELSPVVSTPFGRITVDGRQFQVRRVLGVGPAYVDIMGMELLAGQGFDADAIKERKAQAILSDEIATALWGSAENAVGKTFETVQMGNFARFRSAEAGSGAGGRAASTTQGARNREITSQKFVVSGVFKTPSASWRSKYGTADMLLPYTAASPGGMQIPEGFFWGTTVVNVRNMTLDQARAKIKEALAAQYGDIDVAVWQGNPNSPDLKAETTAKSLESLVLLVSALGLVLVLVSGVGMYGIMTVEVAGRSRQYGIRRALGANLGHIYALVSSQAAAIGLLGGIIGLALASALNLPIVHALSPWFERVGLQSDIVDALGFNPLPFVLGLLAITASSTLFGLLPALRMRTTTPIQLLREDAA